MKDLQALQDWVLGRGVAGDDPGQALALADAALEKEDTRLAVAALDRAYGLDPSNERIRTLRSELLEKLIRVDQYGLRWRFIPHGTFLMGSHDGDVDERPVHPVTLRSFWMMEAPVSRATARGLGLEGPNQYLSERLRYQYCDDSATPQTKSAVAVSYEEALSIASNMSDVAFQVSLPTEAQWERAARGGLIGKRYSWGDEPPTADRCDADHFGEFFIRPPIELPPNGYGLHGMCGGVWEWTADIYDALAYHPKRDDTVPQRVERVLRGGSFADCPEAVTVSFRMSQPTVDEAGEPTGCDVPNVGVRLICVER